MLAITAEMVEARRRRGIRGRVRAHYQLVHSEEKGRDVFWVESYKPSGEFDSGHLVELADGGGFLWGLCRCKWYREFRHDGTICKHLLEAVDTQRERG